LQLQAVEGLSLAVALYFMLVTQEEAADDRACLTPRKLDDRNALPVALNRELRTLMNCARAFFLPVLPTAVEESLKGRFSPRYATKQRSFRDVSASVDMTVRMGGGIGDVRRRG
jgi:hypothetical protein